MIVWDPSFLCEEDRGPFEAFLEHAIRDAERAAAERMRQRCAMEAEDWHLCCECGADHLDIAAAIRALPLEEPRHRDR